MRVKALTKRLPASPLTRQSVYNWISCFDARADLPVELRVSDGNRSGRPPTALGIIDPFINSVTDLDPRTLGYASTIWTATAVATATRPINTECGFQPKASTAPPARLDIIWKRPRPSTLAARASLATGERGLKRGL